MARPTKIILILSIAVFAIMWMRPPWIYIYPNFGFQGHVGYHWIFDKPMPYGVQLDYTSLIIQNILVAIAGIALWLWSKRVRVPAS